MAVLNRWPVWHTGEKLGFGSNYTYSEFSPSNQWIERARDGHQENLYDDAFRKASKFTVVTEIESADGRIQSSVMRQREFAYEDTTRAAVEMAVALLFQSSRVVATQTGGVFLSATGWGDVLLENLNAIGIETVAEKPGRTAADVVNDEWQAWGGCKVLGGCPS